MVYMSRHVDSDSALWDKRVQSSAAAYRCRQIHHLPNLSAEKLWKLRLSEEAHVELKWLMGKVQRGSFKTLFGGKGLLRTGLWTTDFSFSSWKDSRRLLTDWRRVFGALGSAQTRRLLSWIMWKRKELDAPVFPPSERAATTVLTVVCSEMLL